MNIIYLNINQFSNETTVLLSLVIMLLSGFFATRITNLLKLPEVTGYIISGIIIGPYIFNLIPETVINNMSFITDMALAFVAFDVGKFFKKEILKKSGLKIITITLLETLIAGALITLLMHYVFYFKWSFSLLLGAIATATSPASTMMTINEYKAKGSFVYTLLQVVALDDVVSLILFSVVSVVVSASHTGDVGSSHIILPFLYNVLFLIIGFIAGLLLSKLLSASVQTKRSRLIIVLIILLAISGLSSIVNISPLLSCMVFSTTYVNISKDEKLYKEINQFNPPILSLFFILSGMSLDMTSLSSLGIVGVAYFVVRIIGKYIGAYIGSSIVGANKSTKRYLGFALIPQAGVAIGLAFLGSRMLPTEVGNKLVTIVLASSVLYELIGPVAAKWALFSSGAIKER